MAALLRRCLPSALARVLQESCAHALPGTTQQCWTHLGAKSTVSGQRAPLHISAFACGLATIHLEPLWEQAPPVPESEDDEDLPQPQNYIIEVVTGSVRGAGTHNLCTLQLFGARFDGPIYSIGDVTADTSDTGFDRNSTKLYSITCLELGALRRIHLIKSQGGHTELGSGWFLERITVTQPDGVKVTFPCHAWLGLPDDAVDCTTGEYERNLLPLINPQVMPLRERDQPTPISIRASGLAIPHPDKAEKGMKGINQKNLGYAGEDAYFYTDGNNDMFGMGVADGIYSWRAQNIDSGIFSRTLMETARHMVEAGFSDVLKVVQIANRKVQSEGVYGSSTMCMVSIDKHWARIHSANLGDSGFMIVGSTPDTPKPHIKYRTSPQEHEFGWPYQLGLHTNHEPADAPEECQLASIRALPGDIVIVGSDGLFDNLFDRDIYSIVMKHHGTSASPAPLVRELMHAAYTNSRSRKAVTPYSFGASEWFDMVYNGGKPDDIAIVAAYLS